MKKDFREDRFTVQPGEAELIIEQLKLQEPFIHAANRLGYTPAQRTAILLALLDSPGATDEGKSLLSEIRRAMQNR